MARNLLMLAGTLSMMVATNCAFADVLHVPSEYPSIQGAINAAVDGDEIVVAPDTYTENINFLGKAITVRSQAGPEQTTIDASANGSAVVFWSGEGADSVLDGFTLRNGTGTEWSGVICGGGLFVTNSSPTLRNLHIVDNTSEIGGGVGFRFSFAHMSDCVIENNAAGLGGASGGGGVHCYLGGPTLLNCSVRHNHCPGTASGGGLASINSNVTISSSEIVDNSSYEGGGLYLFASTGVIMNCTLANNLTNVGTEGAAVRAVGSNFSTTFVINSVLWDNDGNVNPLYSDGAINVWDSSIEGGWDDPTVCDLDPRFVDPENGDYRLAADSPLIDLGTNDFLSYVCDWDLAGNPRRVNPMDATEESEAMIDIGAYEVQPDDISDPEPCPGDATGDGSVDLLDVLTVIGEWGGCADCDACPADLNSDCVVALSDLLEVIEHWGNACE